MFSQRLAAVNLRFFLMRSCFFCCLREIDEAPEVWRFIPAVVGVTERLLTGRRRPRCLLLSFEFIVGGNEIEEEWRARRIEMIVLCEETTFLIKPNTARFQTPNRTFSRMTKVESHDSNDREASRHDIKIRKMLP